MVFFAAALLVTGMLLNQSGSYDGAHEDGSASFCAPSDLLVVLMRASVGTSMELSTSPPVTVTGYEEFSEVLSFELDEIDSGTPVELFAAFNDILCWTLSGACSPTMEPHLVAFREDGSYDEPLLAIPSAPDPTALAFAGSVTLPRQSGGHYIVVLVLDPASPSEGGGV